MQNVNKILMLIIFALLAVIGAMVATGQSSSASVALDEDAQKEPYSLGVSIGRYMVRELDKQKEIGFDINNELIVKGFRDALGKKAQLSEEEVMEVMKNLDKKLSEARTQKAEQDAAKHLDEGAKFLESNKTKANVKVTDSGLQYEILTAGEGLKPAETDTVEVHYRGTLLDGTEFDSSYERGQPVKLSLNRVIPGWSEGVQLMSKGSKYKFYIPASLAYGENGAGKIPGNATLIFEVELISIEQPSADSSATSTAAK